MIVNRLTTEFSDKNWNRQTLDQFLQIAENQFDRTHSGKQSARVFSNRIVIISPPMGDRLVVAVGLMGSEDPADSAF